MRRPIVILSKAIKQTKTEDNMNRRKKPPVDGNMARHYLRLAGHTQREIARHLGISECAVSRVLDGLSYSQPVWNVFNKFTKNIQLRRAS
jgi:hypothetical protein